MRAINCSFGASLYLVGDEWRARIAKKNWKYEDDTKPNPREFISILFNEESTRLIFRFRLISGSIVQPWETVLLVSSSVSNSRAATILLSSFLSRRVALLHLCPVPLEFRLNGDVTFYLSQDRKLAEVERVQLTKFRAAPCRRKITAINRKTVFISRFLSFTTVHIDRSERKARTARQFHSPTGYFHRQRPRRFSSLPPGLHVN